MKKRSNSRETPEQRRQRLQQERKQQEAQRQISAHLPPIKTSIPQNTKRVMLVTKAEPEPIDPLPKVQPLSPTYKKMRVLVRMWVLFWGASLIIGSAIATWNHFTQSKPPAPKQTKVSQPNPLNFTQELTQELGTLKSQILAIASQQPELELQLLAADLDTKSFVAIQPKQVYASASLIKLPLLVALLQEVDQGRVQLDQMLTITADVRVGEAGDLQDLPLGSQVSLLDVATKMIVISDNTATNLIIKRLGGIAKLNQKFQAWGLVATVLRSPLPDLKGTNTTSTEDLVNLLAGIESGRWLKPRSRDRLLDIMRRTENDQLLPQGIPSNARIAHKTGQINQVIGDAGIVDTPDGKRYIIAAIVKRTKDDAASMELIRTVSRLTYTTLTGKLPQIQVDARSHQPHI
ncbi:MAG: serine hydrolase [Pseudanabaenaceae cyanobacterium bins.68]|nr:serine hydrolase [Pseudanabaenaceae cyanobacterium bins.68]